jgi:hypothetical protein
MTKFSSPFPEPTSTIAPATAVYPEREEKANTQTKHIVI